MSALVEIWEGELTKIRERVRLGKILQGSKLKKEAEEKAEEVEEEKRGKRPETERASRADTTMSEATVNLLMDRFVPW